MIPVFGALLLVHHGNVLIQRHLRANRKDLIAVELAVHHRVVLKFLLQGLVVAVLLLRRVLHGSASVLDLLALHGDPSLPVLVGLFLGHY